MCILPLIFGWRPLLSFLLSSDLKTVFVRNLMVSHSDPVKVLILFPYKSESYLLCKLCTSSTKCYKAGKNSINQRPLCGRDWSLAQRVHM